MDKFDFYKEFYFKELDRRIEINNSLSLPIGIITALIASAFYLITNFSYKCSIILSILFILFIATGIIFLGISIYYLIKSYSGFPKGYEYAILPDTNQIDLYETQLKAHYIQNHLPDTSSTEVKEFILTEMIKNTGQNQINNKAKDKFRYKCEDFLIASLIIICISLLTFIPNYCIKPEKNNLVEAKIMNSDSVNVCLNSKENRNFIIEILKDTNMAKSNIVTKPSPPSSQIIKEGQDPKPRH